jgi:hypothetical protein
MPALILLLKVLSGRCHMEPVVSVVKNAWELAISHVQPNNFVVLARPLRL